MSAGLNVGTVVAKFTADISELKRGVAEAKASVSGLGSGFTSAGAGVKSFFSGVGAQAATMTKTVATFGTIGAAALGAVGVAGLKSASGLEQTRTGLEVMLGSADKAKVLMGDVVKLAAETPFEFPELAGATKKLLAFGVGETEVVDKMRMLGDVAAGTGAPLSNLTTVYGQVRAAGRLMGQDMNQFINAGIPMYEELAKVMKKPASEIKALGEQGKISFDMVDQAMQNLTSNGGRFEGMMAKQSKTLGGLWSTLTDNINLSLMSILGMEATGDVRSGSFFDKTRNAVASLIEFITAHQEQINSFFASIGTAIQSFADSPLVQAFVDAMVAFGGWIVENKDIVIPFLQGLAIAIGGIMIISTLASVIATVFSPLGILIVVIALLYTAWKTNFLGMRDILQGVWDFIKIFISMVSTAWDNWGKYIWASIKSWLSAIWGVFTLFFDIYTTILTVLYLFFTGKWGAMFQAIKDGTSSALNIIKGIFEDAWAGIKNGIAAVYNFFIGKFDEMWAKATEYANKIRHAISDAFDKDKRNSPSIADKVNDLKSFVEGNQFGFTPNVVPMATSSVNQSINATINNGVDLDMLGNRMAFLMRNN